MTIDDLLGHFENVRQAGDSQWSAQCPVHDDRTNSLCIKAADDGTLLLKCQANCNTADVLRAKGLEFRDLFPSNNGNGHASSKPEIEKTYDYRNETGEVIFQVVRYRPKGFRQRRPKDGGGWDWSVKGLRVVPYRLPELFAAPEEIVFIPEGEKDCDNLARIGIVATTNAGGAGKWNADHSHFLRGRNVVILPDADTPGRKHAEQIARSLRSIAGSVKIVELPNLVDKGDVSDWIAAGGTKEELLRLAESATEYQAEEPATPANELRPILIGQLIDDNPRLHEPVIDGLLRRGETANIISVSKVGKSWLAIMLALSIARGRKFLDTYECKSGRVLYIDNELHAPTIAHRFQTVANAMQIPASQYRLEIDVLSLRGRLRDINGIGELLEPIAAGDYLLIISDAFYRTVPKGVSENDNSAIMGIYNLIDSLTSRLNCGWLNVHHSSKGSQSDKSVVDVGAGAGSQSRAADLHAILRPHEDDGCSVLEAVTRSFPPVEPLALRWNFPLWSPDDSIDPGKLKGKQMVSEQRQAERDTEAMVKLADALEQGPATLKLLQSRTGLSRVRCQRVLNILESGGSVRHTEAIVRGNECWTYESVNLDNQNGCHKDPF
jgi:AAA domain